MRQDADFTQLCFRLGDAISHRSTCSNPNIYDKHTPVPDVFSGANDRQTSRSLCISPTLTYLRGQQHARLVDLALRARDDRGARRRRFRTRRLLRRAGSSRCRSRRRGRRRRITSRDGIRVGRRIGRSIGLVGRSRCRSWGVDRKDRNSRGRGLGRGDNRRCLAGTGGGGGSGWLDLQLSSVLGNYHATIVRYA
jgi:hypothetical protein